MKFSGILPQVFARGLHREAEQTSQGPGLAETPVQAAQSWVTPRAEAAPVRIGVFAETAEREGRGIPISTRAILTGLADLRLTMENPPEIDLLHYQGHALGTNFGIADARPIALPMTHTRNKLMKVFQEQVVSPLAQLARRYDVVWHPQNRAQVFTPTGYVVTLHDVLPFENPALISAMDWDDRLLLESRVLSSRHADRVITDSEYSRQRIIEHTGAAPEKVLVVPLGIRHDVFNTQVAPEDLARVREQYGLSDKFLLTVGGYVKHKNLTTLVDAYAQSELPGLGYQLVMVGPKTNTGFRSVAKELERYVEERGLTEQVRMLSLVPEPDLVCIYNAATLFAITSVLEGFGLPPVEAMATGTPVVSSNTTSLPEVLGEAALYADPTDPASFAEQFNLLANDRELWAQKREQGFEQASRYTHEQAAERVLDVLLEVAAERRARR